LGSVGDTSKPYLLNGDVYSIVVRDETGKVVTQAWKKASYVAYPNEGCNYQACVETTFTDVPPPTVDAGADTGTTSEGGAVDAGNRCRADLVAFGCPATLADTTALVHCQATPYEWRQAQCGTGTLFDFGHDGNTSCLYDATGALIGGSSCGVPPLYSSSCPCSSGGSPIPSECSTALTLICPLTP
jgi:hypothetical protein